MVTHPDAELRSVSPRSRDTLVAVCFKCAGDGAALRKALKGAFQQRRAGKSVRIVKSSCLDICPKRGIALAVAGGPAEESGVRYFVVRPRADLEAVAAQLAHNRTAARHPRQLIPSNSISKMSVALGGIAPLPAPASP